MSGELWQGKLDRVDPVKDMRGTKTQPAISDTLALPPEMYKWLERVFGPRANTFRRVLRSSAVLKAAAPLYQAEPSVAPETAQPDPDAADDQMVGALFRAALAAAPDDPEFDLAAGLARLQSWMDEEGPAPNPQEQGEA